MKLSLSRGRSNFYFIEIILARGRSNFLPSQGEEIIFGRPMRNFSLSRGRSNF